MPCQYYDLSPAETSALLKGKHDDGLEQWRMARMIGTLLRNAHFKDPVSETEFLPLPGDAKATESTASPMSQFIQLAAAFGGVIVEEDTPPQE